MQSDNLQALLRLHPEPYIFYDDWHVHAALTRDPPGYLEHLAATLTQIAREQAILELPPKAVFADPGERSDFRVMPCVVRFPDRVRKTVKIIGTNWPRKIVPGEISVGQAFSLHADENFIEAGFAACILSSARTGACVATSIRLLASRSETLVIIGAGRVGYYSAFYAPFVGTVRRVFFSDRNHERAQLAARLLAEAHPGIETAAIAANDWSVQPDVLILATDSEAPLFDASGYRPHLVVSVGADTDWQREITPAVLDHYAIVVDTPDSRNHGDLRLFQEKGLLHQRAIPDLRDIIRNSDGRLGPTLFVSTGSALFDNLTIDYLLCNGL